VRQFARQPGRHQVQSFRILTRRIMGSAIKGPAAAELKVERELSPHALMRVGDKGHQIC
jgi:hypothetical protein